MKLKISVRLPALVAAASLLLGGCAGRLEPVESPVEITPQASQATQWTDLEALRSDDWFQPLNTGREALDWRLRAIDSAIDSIDLQTFIWDLDGSGSLIKGHLLDAAARGVFVRVLVDDSFILDADPELLAIDSHDNIEIKVFNPYKRRSSHVALREVLNLAEFHRLNHRMHNKVMVIDNRVAVMGGRNLADHYFGFDERDNFRDMEVMVGGPVVHDLANGFDRYWNNHWSFPIDKVMEVRAGPGSPEPVKQVKSLPQLVHLELSPQQRQEAWVDLLGSAHAGTATLLLDEPPTENPASGDQPPVQVGQHILREIDATEDELWMVSAYFIPTPELEDAIQRAIQRGVKVKILTNSINSNNHITAHSAYRKHLETLLAMGADVHEVREDAEDRDVYIESPVDDKSLCLHAKILVFDNDRVYLGSANLDPRSLQLNTEMGLVIESESLNAEIRHSLEPDFSLRNAWQLQMDSEGKVSWISDTQTLDQQPAHSFMQRIEDWFFGILPIENEM